MYVTVLSSLITGATFSQYVFKRQPVIFVSDIAMFVLKRDVKLQLTN